MTTLTIKSYISSMREAVSDGVMRGGLEAHGLVLHVGRLHERPAMQCAALSYNSAPLVGFLFGLL